MLFYPALTFVQITSTTTSATTVILHIIKTDDEWLRRLLDIERQCLKQHGDRSARARSAAVSAQMPEEVLGKSEGKAEASTLAKAEGASSTRENLAETSSREQEAATPDAVTVLVAELLEKPGGSILASEADFMTLLQALRVLAEDEAHDVGANGAKLLAPCGRQQR